jgi:hypothetical protein
MSREALEQRSAIALSSFAIVSIIAASRFRWCANDMAGFPCLVICRQNFVV